MGRHVRGRGGGGNLVFPDAITLPFTEGSVNNITTKEMEIKVFWLH